ncbi:hypothetical protein KY363_02690 [Candidatus Woesearchaeota archaeon]|nr:hypothetical protein [Candidatus Woesearchaeota archaeon]
MKTERDKMAEVNRVYKECVMRGRISPYEAAQQISEAMGGLTRVDYNPDTKFRLYNHSQNMGIALRGLNRKQSARLEELVVLAHHLSEDGRQGFDSTSVSEIRLETRGGSPISTKHYRPAYDRFQQQVLIKYAA